MNILITGAWTGAEKYIPEIKSQGHKVVFMQWEQDPLPCSPDWVEGVVCNGLFLHHEIEQFKNLRYIQLTSAGYDRVPMDYVRNHVIESSDKQNNDKQNNNEQNNNEQFENNLSNNKKIEIHNARGVYSIPMAEFAVAGVLSIYKKLNILAMGQKEHRWTKQRDLSELYGKKVCIVGMGSVGIECAKRFEAFGCKIIGIGRNDDLNEGLTNADIVILTLPYTKETHHLIDAERLKLPSPSAVWVNISRGGVIDQEALIKHLQTDGSPSHAVLDVFEEEPLLVDSPLWDMQNVIITPHNSFVGDGDEERLSDVIIKNLNCLFIRF